MQVIRVGEHHLGARGRQLIRADTFDGGKGAHRHESRRLDSSVRG